VATFEPDNVEAFVSGAIGQPGSRTFFVQVAGDGALISMKCEKQHVSTLCQALGSMLTDLPPVDPAVVPRLAGLRTPVLAEWVLGPMGVGYEAETDRIVILFREIQVFDSEAEAEEEMNEPLTPWNATVKFTITRGQAVAFVEHGMELVKAGRPSCVVCGSPIDPDGFRCVCFN
jgi:uncharacterized repeat protein (TIGR03847 family)